MASAVDHSGGASAASPQVRTSPIDRAALETNIKKAALRSLGHACNRADGGKLGDLALVESSADNVETHGLRSIRQILIRTNRQTAFRTLNTLLGLGIRVESLFSSIGADHHSSEHTATNSSQLFCLAAHIERTLCRFRQIPEPRSDLAMGDPRRGDGFVKEVTIYSGYIVCSIILTKERNKKEEARHSGEVKIGSLFSAALEAAGLRQTLNGREVKDILTKAEGFGYTLRYNHPHNLQEIETTITDIEDRYIEGLSSFSDLVAYVDPRRGIEDYSMFPLSSPRTPRSNLVRLPLPHPIPPGRVDFGALAERIKVFFGPAYTKALTLTLGDEALGSLLSFTNEIFPSTLQSLERRASGQSHTFPTTMVIGRSGMGKSLTIGCMLGAKVTRQQISIDGIPTDVFDYENMRPGLPPIGHALSHTRGCVNYGCLMDTAGLLDTKEAAADIVNAAAIKLAQMSRHPGRIIFVLNQSYFSGRNTLFFEAIDTLRRILHNPVSRTTWPAILLLINETDLDINSPEGPIGEGSIRNKIRLSIARKVADARDRYPEIDARYQQLRSSLTRELAEQLREGQAGFELEKVQEYIKIRKEIEALELLASTGRIIVADFRNRAEETRVAIETWMKDPSIDNFTDESFDMENLVRGGYPKFTAAVTAVVSYFSEQLRKRTRLTSDIDKLNHDIGLKEHEIREIDSLLSDSTISQPVVDALTQQKTDRKGAFEKARSDLTDIEASIQKLIDDIGKLEADEGDFSLPAVTSDETIDSRNFLAYPDRWARMYAFRYQGIPLKRVDKFIPTLTARTGKGVFIQTTNDESESNLSQGSYRDHYRPAWWGYDDDAKAALLPVAARKESLETKAVVESKQKQLSELHEKKDALESTMSGLQVKITESGILLDSRMSQDELEANQALRRRYLSDWKSLDRQVVDCAFEIEKITSELATYSNFCRLLSKVIKGLKLNVGAGQQKEDFDLFVGNFQPSTLNA